MGWSTDMDAAPRDGRWLWLYVPRLVENDRINVERFSSPWPVGCRLGFFVEDLGEWHLSGINSNAPLVPTHWQPRTPPPETPESET